MVYDESLNWMNGFIRRQYPYELSVDYKTLYSLIDKYKIICFAKGSTNDKNILATIEKIKDADKNALSMHKIHVSNITINERVGYSFHDYRMKKVSGTHDIELDDSKNSEEQRIKRFINQCEKLQLVYIIPNNQY